MAALSRVDERASPPSSMISGLVRNGSMIAGGIDGIAAVSIGVSRMVGASLTVGRSSAAGRQTESCGCPSAPVYSTRTSPG